MSTLPSSLSSNTNKTSSSSKHNNKTSAAAQHPQSSTITASSILKSSSYLYGTTGATTRSSKTVVSFANDKPSVSYYHENYNNHYHDDNNDSSSDTNGRQRLDKPGTTTTTSNTNTNTNTNNNGGNSLLNEEEEDVFDPSFSYTVSGNNRGNVGNGIGGTGIPKRGDETLFDGEEQDVDEKYSLFHDPDVNANIDSHANADAIADDIADADAGAFSVSCPIEPFNMNAEREDGMGYFDGDTYIFRKRGARGGGGGRNDLFNGDNDLDGDDEDAPDSWMNQVYKSTGTKSNGSGASSSGGGEQDNTSNHDALGTLLDTMSKDEIYKDLASLLANDSETVLQALTRYGLVMKQQQKSSSSGGSNSNKRQKTMTTMTTTIIENSSGYEIAKRSFFRLTELSNMCMMKFDDGQIYNRDRKYLMDCIMAAGHGYGYGHGYGHGHGYGQDHNNDDAIATAAATTTVVQWEYRGKQDNLIHGPFTTKQMMEWIQAGYFVGSNAVDVRMITAVGADQPQGQNKDAVMNDLLGDLEESDDDDGDEKEKDENDGKNNSSGNIQKNIETWQRSDQVDFSAYM